MKNTLSAPKKRQSNIELLRIIAMLIIVAHHVAVHSGFGFPSDTVTFNRLWIQFIQIGGKVGVNIFVLISGYFSVTSPALSHNKTVKLWLQIFTYSASLYLIAMVAFDEALTMKGAFKNFMPVTHSKWWFAGTYFILLLLSPFINRLLNSLDKKAYGKFLLITGLCWCVMPSLINQRVQSNSLLWFVFLYSLAGYIRLHVDTTRFKSCFCILGACVATLLIYAWTVMYMVLGTDDEFFAKRITYFHEMYMFPMLLIALLLFLGFLNLNMGYKPIVNVVSSATFGVYLIHENNYIRELLWKTIFNNKAYADSAFLAPYTVLQIFVVFAVCAIIELFRIYCVERLYVGFIDRFLELVKGCFDKLFSLKFFLKIKEYF